MDIEHQHHGSMMSDIMPPLTGALPKQEMRSALDDADDDLLPPPPSLSSPSNAAQHNNRRSSDTAPRSTESDTDGDALVAPLSSHHLRKEQQRRDRERAAAIQAAVNGTSSSSSTANNSARPKSSSASSAEANNNDNNTASNNATTTEHRPRRVHLRLEDSDDDMEPTFGPNSGAVAVEAGDKSMNDEDEMMEEAPPPTRATRRTSSSSLSQILPMAVARRIPSLGLGGRNAPSRGSFRIVMAQRVRADSTLSSDAPPPPEAIRRKTSFFSSEKGKRRLRCMLVSAVVFAVVVIVAGVVLGGFASKGGDGGGDGSDDVRSFSGGEPISDAPTTAPTMFSQTVAIRSVVSTVPTTPSQNGEDDDRPPPYDREGTPQYRALEWLLTQDKHSLQDEGYLDVTTGGTGYSKWAQKIVQRYVLAVLYFSMGLPTKLREELNYLSPVQDECSWIKIVDNTPRGILCDQESNTIVVGISLRHSYLEGTLPDELGALTELIYLDFGDNGLLGGTLPTTALSKLKQLSVLSLFECALTGTIPDNAGDVWSSELATLRLYSNQMTGTVPASLNKLTHLENIFLQDNFFQGSLNPAFCTTEGASGSSLRIGKIREIHADCLDDDDGGTVICDCCTTCCGDENCYASNGN